MPIQWPRSNRPPMMVQGVTRREIRNAFRSGPLWSDKAYKITGVTKDANGTALPNCVVRLYYTLGDSLAGVTTSDASGAFSFSIGPSLTCYIVAYLPGSPDVSGTTVNTLVSA
jgi:hypothetical protein